MKTALTFIMTIIVLPLLVVNFAASDAKYKALEERGLVEAEQQPDLTVPYQPQETFTVACHPNTIVGGIDWFLVTRESDGATISALGSRTANILPGDTMVLWSYFCRQNDGKVQLTFLLDTLRHN